VNEIISALFASTVSFPVSGVFHGEPAENSLPGKPSEGGGGAGGAGGGGGGGGGGFPLPGDGLRLVILTVIDTPRLLLPDASTACARNWCRRRLSFFDMRAGHE